MTTPAASLLPWLDAEIRSRVLAPQAASLEPATVDVDSLAFDAQPSELDLVPLSLAPVSYEVGGGVTLRHTSAVDLTVLDGDPARGMLRRDKIASELVLRVISGVLRGLVSPDGRQQTGPVRWSLDSGVIPGEGTLDYGARITLTIDVDVAPA